MTVRIVIARNQPLAARPERPWREATWQSMQFEFMDRHGLRPRDDESRRPEFRKDQQYRSKRDGISPVYSSTCKSPSLLRRPAFCRDQSEQRRRLRFARRFRWLCQAERQQFGLSVVPGKPQYPEKRFPGAIDATPCRWRHQTRKPVISDGRLRFVRWWDVKDLNLRPKDYESSALTN